MITRADIPNFVMPDRRTKEVDGLALGKELTGLIRGAKTRGAINKALAQHGTLASPEAIESVRQNMGTWFSDPQKIIELQDTLYTREKEGREEKRKIRKVDSEIKVLDQNLLESKDRMKKAAKEASRAESTADFTRASTTITSNILAIENKLDRIYELAKTDPSILQTYAEHIGAYQKQIGSYNKILTELAIGSGIKAGVGTGLDIPTLDQTKVADKTEVAELTKEQIEEQRITAEKSRISQLPLSAVIEQLPDALWNTKERSDYLRKASKKVASAEEELDLIEKSLFNHPDRYIGDSSFVQYNRKEIQKRKEFYEKIKKEGEAEIARLRPEAEAYLLEQARRESAPQVNQDAAPEGTDADFGKSPGLNLDASVNVIDDVIQMALNSPQGQEMMRRLMEEQQIG